MTRELRLVGIVPCNKGAWRRPVRPQSSGSKRTRQRAEWAVDACDLVGTVSETYRNWGYEAPTLIVVPLHIATLLILSATSWP